MTCHSNARIALEFSGLLVGVLAMSLIFLF